MLSLVLSVLFLLVSDTASVCFLTELSLLLAACFAAESDSLRGKQSCGGRRIKLLCIKSMILRAIATHHNQMKGLFLLALYR